MTRPSRRLPRRLDQPAVWLVVAALLYSFWLLELALPTGLSVVDSYVSELLADDQPYRWVFRVTDALAACCLLLAARWMRGRLVVASVLVFAAATLADTVLSLDCAASVDALCRYREATGSVSLGHRLHQVTSVLTFGSALAAAVGLARSTRWWHARVVVTLLATTGVLSAVLVNQPGAGLVQRAQLLTVAAGLLLGARACSSAWGSFVEPGRPAGGLQPGSGVVPDARQLRKPAGVRKTCVMALREDVAAKRDLSSQVMMSAAAHEVPRMSQRIPVCAEVLSC
ncbi:DUF998 domain-containing protein [Lentzea aerocolonigenes]|uniref:DUF998 domain-containing protein n=1 Tax=Lentzea aerocolonigenes TaxID=68170 RepID=UPI00068E3D95|nr:DUF998 domain-containing protein [Lentzea aerocolonigenes]MCP2243989.1 Protein of unknown function (DUF998) [Lentzea aerocolonigenes]